MKLSIVHFQAIEGYPPAINLINYCSSQLPPGSVSFFSIVNRSEIPKLQFNNCDAYRPVTIHRSDKRLARLLKTIWFNLFTMVSLFRIRPSVILYVETSSAFPVFMYMLFFSARTKMCIHYHEYTSPKQYREGMWLDKVWHWLEKKYLYSKAKWISQTNEFRCEFFLKDNPAVDRGLMNVMRNFPPQSWIQYGRREKFIKKPYRVVQIGSLSARHMYAAEFIEWIVKQNGDFELDIYSMNIQEDVLALLQKINSPYIRFKGAISYEKIPEALSGYDAGVVLYKANSENVVYCASNKLFEYLALGIDVWVSDVMLGSQPHYRKDVYPKVLPVAFSNLDQFDWRSAINREGLTFSDSEYYMEKEYAGFVKFITQ